MKCDITRVDVVDDDYDVLYSYDEYVYTLRCKGCGDVKMYKFTTKGKR